MTTLDKLRNLLTRYEHLFQLDHAPDVNPCMDVSFDLIDDTDYYGVDCSGSQQLYMLFFTGSSDYFPAIWIGNDDVNHIDYMPIYIVDLSSDCTEFISCGNIKQYIMQIVEKILLNETISENDKVHARELKRKMEPFSNNVIDKGKYITLKSELN